MAAFKAKSSATRVNPDLPITGNLNLTLVFVDDSSSPPTLRLYKFVLSSTIRTSLDKYVSLK